MVHNNHNNVAVGTYNRNDPDCQEQLRQFYKQAAGPRTRQIGVAVLMVKRQTV